MSPALYIPIFLPLWIAIFISISTQKQQKRLQMIRKRRKQIKEGIPMNNQLIEGYIGKLCSVLYSGTSFGGATGIIVSVADNWLEIDVNDKKKLINIDYITSIEELKPKKSKKNQ